MRVVVTYRPWANKQRYSGPTKQALAQGSTKIDFVIEGFLNAALSRQELAALLARAADLPPVDEPQKRFADVSPESWTFGHINSVVEAGFMEGTGRTTFSPTGSTTRAQAIKAILSFSDLAPRVGQITDAEADAVLARFSDAQAVSSWAKRYLAVPYARN